MWSCDGYKVTHFFPKINIRGEGVKFNKSLLNETGGFNEPTNMGWMTFFDKILRIIFAKSTRHGCY